jgi:hypothetical protein
MGVAMTRYRYPPKALTGDYLRAGGGFAITGGPAFFVPTAPAVTVILGALAALFGIFGLRTALRQFTVIEMSDEAIAVVGAGGKRMAWRDVRHLRLDFYSTRRDDKGGWMQMKISGPSGHIRIDSALDGFARVAGEAATHAAIHGIEITETSQGNFRALGITPPPGGTEAGA